MQSRLWAGLLRSVTRMPILIGAVLELALSVYWLIIGWASGFSTPASFITMAAICLMIMPICVIALVSSSDVRHYYSALRGR